MNFPLPRTVTLIAVDMPDRIPEILKGAKSGIPGLVFNGVANGLRDERIRGTLQFEPGVGLSLMLEGPPRDSGVVRVVTTSAIEEIEKVDDYVTVLRTRSGSTYILLNGTLD